jgi:hypothetical protein
MSEIPTVKTKQPGGAFPNRRTTLILLSVLTLPYIPGLMLSFWLALVSPMMFDGGEDTVAWISFFALCTCPIVFITGLVGGWLSFLLKRYRLALMIMLLPAIELCVLIAVISFAESL